MNITKKLTTVLALLSLLFGLGSAYSSTLSPTQPVGSPFGSKLKLVGTAGETLTVNPTLEIPAEHQGLQVELYALAMFNNGLWLVKQADGWYLFADVEGLPAFDTVTLGKSQAFDLYTGSIDPVKGIDVLYGYRLSDDIHFHGNGFRITISETARKLQELMDTKLAEAETTYGIKYGIPGMIMAVNIQNEGYWVGASGVSDVDTQKPMTEMVNGQFRIGSATKTFTGMAIMQLAEEGKLKLDDTIESWLPGMVPNGENITLRQLLNHTSGISSFANSLTWLVPFFTEPKRQWTPEELVQLTFDETEPLSPPGEKWHYSNTGYVLLGLVVEKATGKTWESEVQRRFIEPLGLKNTAAPMAGEAAIAEEYIHGYLNVYETTEGATGEDKLIRQGPLDPSYTWASGGMLSTIEDLNRWLTAIATGELLNMNYEEEQFTWFLAQSISVNIGLGIIQNPQYGLLGHRGQINGYDVAMQYDWDGGGTIVVMMNRLSAVGNVQQLILYDILSVLHGE